MKKSEHETCTSLAKALGSPFTAMRVGKIKKAVCSDEDLDGIYILPSGVLKITQSIEKEMQIVEKAKPDIVKVKVLHHRCGNPAYIFAKDTETKRKVQVLVPRRKKQILSTVGKVLTVERGLKDGKYLYRFPVSKD
jgi:hypothetical protein